MKNKTASKSTATRVLGVIFALNQIRIARSYWNNANKLSLNFFMENGIIMQPISNIVLHFAAIHLITNRQLRKVTDYRKLEIVKFVQDLEAKAWIYQQSIFTFIPNPDKIRGFLSGLLRKNHLNF
jgi:adenosylmethionine-8-amino-7-oxononanoate aminotransferase